MVAEPQVRTSDPLSFYAMLRFSVVDLLIGATALAHGLPLYTQDADSERMPGLTVVRV